MGCNTMQSDRKRPKSWRDLYTRLHAVTYQKPVIWVLPVVRTSYLKQTREQTFVCYYATPNEYINFCMMIRNAELEVIQVFFSSTFFHAILLQHLMQYIFMSFQNENESAVSKLSLLDLTEYQRPQKENQHTDIRSYLSCYSILSYKVQIFV